MTPSSSHLITQKAWNSNAELWDSVMGEEGNDFFQKLQFPFILEYLDVDENYGLNSRKILDISCGNGILSRKFANLGANVIGLDFSRELIRLAKLYEPKVSNLKYYLADVTKREQLKSWMDNSFDHAVCNMALFDISNIEVLIASLPKIIKPGGSFIFSLLHPSFNNSSTVKIIEENEEGGVNPKFYLKMNKYLSIYEQLGIAISGQKHPQYYYNRPLSYYFQLCFKNGFYMDRYDEPVFMEENGSKPLSWGNNFREFPPVLIARMKLA